MISSSVCQESYFNFTFHYENSSHTGCLYRPWLEPYTSAYLLHEKWPMCSITVDASCQSKCEENCSIEDLGKHKAI